MGAGRASGATDVPSDGQAADHPAAKGADLNTDMIVGHTSLNCKIDCGMMDATDVTESLDCAYWQIARGCTHSSTCLLLPLYLHGETLIASAHQEPRPQRAEGREGGPMGHLSVFKDMVSTSLMHHFVKVAEVCLV